MYYAFKCIQIIIMHYKTKKNDSNIQLNDSSLEIFKIIDSQILYVCVCVCGKIEKKKKNMSIVGKLKYNNDVKIPTIKS